MYKYILVLVILSYKISAQSTVDRVTINGRDAWSSLRSVEKVGDNYYVAGDSGDQSAEDNVIVSKINSSGQILWVYEEQTKDQVVTYDVTPVSDNNIVVASTRVPDYRNLELTFDQLDENGNLLNSTSIFTDDGTDYEGLRAEYSADLGYIVTARTVRNSSLNDCTVPMIVKLADNFTSSSFMELNALLDYGCFEVYDVRYFSDEEVLVTASEHQDSADLKLFSFTLNQELNWETTINFGEISRISFIEKDASGDIILAGFSGNEREEYLTFFQKRSGDGTLITNSLIQHDDTLSILSDGYLREDGKIALLYNVYNDNLDFRMQYSIFDENMELLTTENLPLAAPGVYEEGKDILYTMDNQIAIVGQYSMEPDYDPNGLFLLTKADVVSSVIDGHGSGSPKITIYPNPIRNKVSIDCKCAGAYSVEVFNSIGSKLYTSASNFGSATIEDWNFTAGTYYIRISYNDITYTKKVVAQ